MIKGLAFSTALGLVIGFALVWWTAPNPSGAVFVAVATTLVCNVAGGVISFLIGLLQNRST